MFDVALMSWSEARADAAPIRFKVFVEEQGVPAAIELDEHDSSCMHALARDDAGRAVATGRLLQDGHIGRMAVLREWRGKGVGGEILERLVEAARGRGLRQVVLSAQSYVLDFYLAHGFQAEGEEYMEAGIKHRLMRRKL